MANQRTGKKELPELSRLEMAVMTVVWKLGDCSSAEVIAEFSKQRPLAEQRFARSWPISARGLPRADPHDRAGLPPAGHRQPRRRRRPHARRTRRQPVRRLAARSDRPPP